LKIYEHRVNERERFKLINPMHGVEIDIRSHDGNLILAHDPFVEGELFAEWLQAWKGQPLILNVKEDSLEPAIMSLLASFLIEDYFFLDQNYPSIRRMIQNGITKVATRVSDYEDLGTAFASGSEWVWLDSFSGDWTYLSDVVPKILSNNQKTCLVSPELQRADSQDEFERLREIIQKGSLNITAVCTKNPGKWL
jgi:hypothetical protein